MKKRAVRLLVAIVLLVALIGAFFVVKNLTKEEEKKEKVTPVSQTAVKDIEGLVYSSRFTDGKEISLVREKDIWYYEKDKEFPLNQERITNNMVAAAAEATASRTIENPEEDLSQYGLDEPITKITIKKITGDEVKIRIGNYNESVEGYYLEVEGDQNLYLVDAKLVFAFDADIYELAEKEDFPLVETGSFTHISVQNGDQLLELKGEVEEDSEEVLINQYYLEKEKIWKISENGSTYKEGNQKNIQELISQLSSLNYAKMIEYHADEKVKETYGLGEQAIILTVDYQVLDETTARQVEKANGINEIECDILDKKYILRIGNQVPEDGYSDLEYYVCMEDSEVVYTIRAELIETIVHIDTNQYIQ